MIFYFGSNHAEDDVPGRREWAEFLATLPVSAGAHQITKDAHEADVVINGLSDRLDLGFRPQLVRPLAPQHVRQLVWDWSDKPTGRHSGFYASLDRGYYDPRRHRTMCYPIVFNEMVTSFPQSDATFRYGFMGGFTHRVRRNLFAALSPRNEQDHSLLICQGNDWGALHDRSGLSHKRAYVDFLRQTKFILCPRGIGVGTARFYETLKAGRVPVLISDRFVLPARIDWSSCLVVVGEGELDRIPEAIAEAEPRWPQMAANARRIWEENFSLEKTLDYLAANIADLTDRPRSVTPAMQARFMTNVARRSLVHHLKPYAGRLRKMVRG